MSSEILVHVGPEGREKLIETLSGILTVHEAATLVAKIHERTSQIKKGKRFGMYPIEDPEAFERMKRLEAAYWTADEVDFTQDRNDFEQLSPDEQRPLLMAFGFFAVGDGSIASMLAYRMILTAETFERQCFYVSQLDNERVHGETYGKMIYTLVPDQARRDEIFNAVDRVQSIKKMNEFIEHSFTYPQGKKEIYVSLAAAEYILFTPLFCIIFWYRNYKPGKLDQVLFSNELIAKDEAVHCQNSCENYRTLPDSEKYTDSELHAYIDKVCQLVFDFADEVFSGISLPELTPSNVKQYVKFVADDLLVRLGHSTLYRVESPFVWMTFTNLVPKSNFYEKKVGEYARFNVVDSISKTKQLLSSGSDTAPKTSPYARARTVKF